MAVTAGIEQAGGDAVVVIDADLQDPPQAIVQMVQLWKEGYQVVYGQRDRAAGRTAIATGRHPVVLSLPALVFRYADADGFGRFSIVGSSGRRCTAPDAGARSLLARHD